MSLNVGREIDFSCIRMGFIPPESTPPHHPLCPGTSASNLTTALARIPEPTSLAKPREAHLFITNGKVDFAILYEGDRNGMETTWSPLRRRGEEAWGMPFCYVMVVHCRRRVLNKQHTEGWGMATDGHDFYFLRVDDQGQLKGCFKTVMLDEAHTLRNAASNQPHAVSWLAAKFHLLLSATLIFNSTQDFRGYMLFLFPSASLWSTADWKALGINSNTEEWGALTPRKVNVLSWRLTRRECQIPLRASAGAFDHPLTHAELDLPTPTNHRHADRAVAAAHTQEQKQNEQTRQCKCLGDRPGDPPKIGLQNMTVQDFPIPMQEVLSNDSSRDLKDPLGHILTLEKVDGEPLSDLWTELSSQEQQHGKEKCYAAIATLRLLPVYIADAGKYNVLFSRQTQTVKMLDFETADICEGVCGEDLSDGANYGCFDDQTDKGLCMKRSTMLLNKMASWKDLRNHIEKSVPYTGSHPQYEVWQAAWTGAILNMDQQSQISRLGQCRDERSYVFSAAAERIMNNCRRWKSTSLKNMQEHVQNEKELGRTVHGMFGMSDCTDPQKLGAYFDSMRRMVITSGDKQGRSQAATIRKHVKKSHWHMDGLWGLRVKSATSGTRFNLITPETAPATSGNNQSSGHVGNKKAKNKGTNKAKNPVASTSQMRPPITGKRTRSNPTGKARQPAKTTANWDPALLPEVAQAMLDLVNAFENIEEAHRKLHGITGKKKDRDNGIAGAKEWAEYHSAKALRLMQSAVPKETPGKFYKALGTIRTLKFLDLALNVSDPTLYQEDAPIDPNWDDFGEQSCLSSPPSQRPASPPPPTSPTAIHPYGHTPSSKPPSGKPLSVELRLQYIKGSFRPKRT
ncbi:hypothetical protein CDV55_101255 [Aspergillus turcosus]|nr:hypothetical protein CDV55_101255 [Aspergillus turcosus]